MVPNPPRRGARVRSASPDRERLGLLLNRVRDLLDENHGLQGELARCYQQLGVVFEITEQLSGAHDPDVVYRGLLRRYGELVAACGLYVDGPEGCEAFTEFDARGGRLVADAGLVRAVLADEIDSVRCSRRTRRVELPADLEGELAGADVLLGALAQGAAAPRVIAAVRRAGQPRFEAAETLVSETILVYGGQLLASTLMFRQVQESALETVRALANVIEARDPYTSGHSERVGWLARLTGRCMGLSPEELQTLEWAGMLHDVGKIGIPEHVINKPERLSNEEFEAIKNHPRLSYEILRPVRSLAPILPSVLHHHENYDGSGYPDGLRGDAIPLPARIIRVVDTFDAITSSRAYRGGVGVQRAMTELQAGARKAFDPGVVAVFATAFLNYMRTQPVDFRRRFAHIASDGARDEALPAATAVPIGAIALRDGGGLMAGFGRGS